MKKKQKDGYLLKSEVLLLIQNYIRGIQMMDGANDSGIPQLYEVMRQVDNMSVEEQNSDYEQWKQWFDKWKVKYEEEQWDALHHQKELIIGGSYCQASVVFDLNNNFIRMTAYE